LLGTTIQRPFILTSTSLMLPNAVKPRLAEHSLFECMHKLAQSELADQHISCAIRQEGNSLQRICRRVCAHEFDSGCNIWAAFALLSYLSNEPMGRSMLRSQHVNDLDSAVAEAFLSYGRAEVTRRSRLNETQLAQAASIDEPIPVNPAPSTSYETEMMKAADNVMEADVESILNETVAPEDDDEPSVASEETVVLPKQRQPNKTTSGGGAASRTASRAAAPPYSRALDGSGLEQRSVLSLKRKRTTIASSCTSLILDYWAAALDSSHSHILLMLIASKTSAAAQAAEKTLSAQGQSSENTMLDEVSKRSAVDSAKALRQLVRQDDPPRILTWRAKASAGNNNNKPSMVYVGLARSLADLKDTCTMAVRMPVHAPGVLPPAVHHLDHHLEGSSSSSPGRRVRHTSVAWVSAVHLDPEGSQPAPLTGVMETYRKVATWARSGGRADILKNRVLDSLKGCTSPFSVSGVARSVVTVDARLVCSASTVEAGKTLSARLVDALNRAVDASGAQTHHEYPLEVATVLSVEPLVDKRAGDDEHRGHSNHFKLPLSTPSCNLALGMQVNEFVRVLHKGKVHRGDPCRAFFGMELSQGEVSDSEMSFADKPGSLLTLVDLKIQPDEQSAPPERIPRRLDAVLLSAPVSMTLAGDSAMRVAECVRLLVKHAQPAQARAVLLASCTTASHLGELTNLAGAGRLNTAAASAKRVLVADNCKRLWLTPYQVFRVGHRGVPASFPNSAWRGAYPVGLEIGSAGGLGRNAAAETADRRQHGKFLVSQDVADEYSIFLAEKTIKQVDAKHYDCVPIQCRGIVHHAIPGLHSFLDDMVDGLESIREIAGITAATVDSLQCLPFGPYSDNLAPRIQKDLDPTVAFSNPYDEIDLDGRAFLVDGTLEDASIFCEPLVPRLQILDASDNPFASIHDHLDSFFNAVSTIALSLAARDKDAGWLYHCLDVFHGHDALEIDDFESMLALDTMVLMSGAIYPVVFDIGETIVLPAYAKGLAWVAKQQNAGQRDLNAILNAGVVSNEEHSEAMAYFDRFRRANNSAWPAFAELVDELIILDGRFDSTLESISRLKRLVDGALRNAWRAASGDGVSPPPSGHPLQQADRPSEVTAKMLAPIFVDSMDASTGQWTDARGAVVGIKPGNFRQLTSMMVAASLPGVDEINVCRNEGGLLLRPSSSVDILNQNGTPRSDKGISPIGIEGDTLSFGSRDAKLRNCKRQRKSWEYNLRAIMPLCTSVSTPRPNWWLYRGEKEALEYVKQQTTGYRATGIVTREDAAAKQSFMDAARTDCSQMGHA
jgi:hypothetical protein